MALYIFAWRLKMHEYYQRCILQSMYLFHTGYLNFNSVEMSKSKRKKNQLWCFIWICASPIIQPYIYVYISVYDDNTDSFILRVFIILNHDDTVMSCLISIELRLNGMILCLVQNSFDFPQTAFKNSIEWHIVSRPSTQSIYVLQHYCRWRSFIRFHI